MLHTTCDLRKKGTRHAKQTSAPILESMLKTLSSYYGHQYGFVALLSEVREYLSCASMLHRSGGFFSKILKKRQHKEAQTPDNGELTLAQILNEKPAGGEGKNTNMGLFRLPFWKISESIHWNRDTFFFILT